MGQDSPILITIAVFIFFIGANLAQGELKKTSLLERKADEIIESSGLKKSDLSLFVADRQGNTVFSLNAEKHLIPASITKLITTAAITSELEPDFRFHTQIFTDGSVTDENLNGNIYLKGGGDPAFVSEKMWMLVNDFTREKIKTISGNIIVDDSFFDDERFDKGREADRNDRAYDAPVSALSFDWNSTTIYVRPGKVKGEKAQVFIDPANQYVVLDNQVTTAGAGTDLTATRSDDADHDTIVVSGKIALGSPEKHIFKNISDPALYAGHCFREFLRQRHIEVAGKVTHGVVPAAAHLATDLKGEPLGRLITDMNKFSNNFVAEMLAKDLASVKTNSPGHMKDGITEIKNFLTAQLGWASKDFELANVSGFTRKNSFSSSQFVSLLRWIQRQFVIYPEILTSLPIAGIDGTLEKRMKDTEAVRWVRAKTGLLTGVVALAGYIGRPDEVLMFAFIYNGRGEEAHVRATFDSLAASFVK